MMIKVGVDFALARSEREKGAPEGKPLFRLRITKSQNRQSLCLLISNCMPESY